MANAADQKTDDDQGKSPNMVGSAGSVYYAFATGHVGQDEEHLGDDSRAWNIQHNVPATRKAEANRKDNSSEGTQGF